MRTKARLMTFQVTTTFTLILTSFSSAWADPGLLFKGTTGLLRGELAPYSEKPFKLWYRFDKLARDALPGDRGTGFYRGVITSGRFTVQTASGVHAYRVDVAGSRNAVLVRKTPIANEYHVEANLVRESGTVHPDVLVIELADSRGSATSNDALPLVVSLGEYKLTRTLRVTGPGLSFTGTVTSVEAIPDSEGHVAMLEDFVSELNTLGLPRSVEARLMAILNNALSAARRGNQDATFESLRAATSEIEGQQSKHIPPAIAAALRGRLAKITATLPRSAQSGMAPRFPF